MKWITRERVKVDRGACPWLIKKFVDKDAEVFFVPADKVSEEAKRIDAIPYDVSSWVTTAKSARSRPYSKNTISPVTAPSCCLEKSSTARIRITRFTAKPRARALRLSPKVSVIWDLRTITR